MFGGLRPVELLGPCGLVESLRPCGPLVCWFVGANDRTRCRGVLHTPHRAPRHGAETRPWAFIHSGPWGPFGGRMPFRPGVSPPRVSPPGVSPRAMVRRPYRPPRVRPIRARGARLGGVFNTPLHRVRAFGSLRVPGQIRRCPQTPPASFPAPAGAVLNTPHRAPRHGANTRPRV